MPSWLIWVIVAIVVVAIIVALVAASNKKKQERNRVRAGELREEAATQATTVQKREAHARETEAKAAAARAEADRKQAEADRLEAEAHERQQAAAGHREEHHASLRRADELDPDVDTRSNEYAAPETTHSTTHTPGHESADRTLGHDGHEGTVGREGTVRHEDIAVGHEGRDGALGQHSHDTVGDRRVQDRLGGHDDQEATVTHPDGTTETVNQPYPRESGTEGGTHRA